MRSDDEGSDTSRSRHGGPPPRERAAARKQANTLRHRALRYILSFGSIAKGIIYLAIGGIALKVALQGWGQTEDLEGTLLEIGDQPFGNAALIALFLGLLHYAAWRLAQAILDPERLHTEPFGWWMRIWSGFIGLLHLGFAYQVITEILWGWGLSEKEQSSEQVESWTSAALGWPGGRWIVGAAALTAFGFCIGQLAFAYRALFAHALDMRRTGRRARLAVIWLGRIGFASRATLAALIGGFLFKAMRTKDPEQAIGFAEALQWLLQEDYGPWLLGAEAIGLMAFGLFFFGLSRYQAVDQPAKPALDS